MISYASFQQILNDLQRGYGKIQACWFPEYWKRQLDSERAEAHRKLLDMIRSDVEEAFNVGDTERAKKLWDLFIRCMDIIEYYPDSKDADLKRVEALYTAYEKEYK